MNAFIKTLGISILLMMVTGFIGVVVIQDIFYLSLVSLVITYFFNGFIASATNTVYPYFNAYMTAMVLIIINLVFSYLVLGLNILMNPDIVFYSLLIGTSVSLAGAYAKIFMKNRSMAHA